MGLNETRGEERAVERNLGLEGNAVLGFRLEDDSESPPQSEYQDMDDDEEGGGDDRDDISDLEQDMEEPDDGGGETSTVDDAG